MQYLRSSYYFPIGTSPKVHMFICKLIKGTVRKAQRTRGILQAIRPHYCLLRQRTSRANQNPCIDFNTLYTNVEFRRVQPVDYKLFQVADLICTLELLKLKCENSGLSASETAFYGSARDLREKYIKPLDGKKL